MLVAIQTEPLGGGSRRSRPLVEEPEADVSDLVDVFSNRVGENRLCRFVPIQSDLPERSVVRISSLSLETGLTWEGDWPRPPRLLARPEPVETIDFFRFGDGEHEDTGSQSWFLHGIVG